mgnify:CR=1 FL=1
MGVLVHHTVACCLDSFVVQLIFAPILGKNETIDISRKMATTEATTSAPPTAGDCAARAQGMVDFLNAACSNFHAVAEAKRRLVEAGYQELSERSVWSLKAGGKYFFSRNASALVAFAIGEKYKPGNGMYMIGTHTDSPCLKLKPVSKTSSVGIQQIAVQTYGGGLWTTWFDRDLGIAGRVLVREEKGLKQHLVRIDRPICRIPMLAIHMSRGSGTKFELNTENHLKAVLCSEAEAALNRTASADDSSPSHANSAHQSALLDAIAAEIGVNVKDIEDVELQLTDVQPSTVGGLFGEYIFSGRIDNLSSCYTSLAALIESTTSPDSLTEETGVRLIVHFDHEEVGSNSAPGAQGPRYCHGVPELCAVSTYDGF